MIELVHKAQEGDEEAFLSIFQEYEIDLYRIAFVYVKNKDDALDVVQETAYRSFKKIGTLRNPVHIKTWLIKIAISCATDLLRKQKKVVHLHPEYLHLIDSAEQDIPLSLSLKDLIETLNESEKSIILWKFYYGYTLQEISEIEESPLGTVKSVLYRALAKLRKQIRRADMYE
ncbi:sigma-70 family RNA polymerase sigma factor [Bacillus salacetis]|uniref:Sigma-70 family RNA polymerase sigma factor n=1 Tax=Bacillus salacetis TaxID=2315464 RepID=A0A3A1QUD2_9BACI|nr:sigma-70 family RNA polymerase sigma factor [Bacillus salacetis]RIW28697.1 sigma-70 family RNA polymerase sigma factor [Bacillus salacetis]